MTAGEALALIQRLPFETVLDIGSGDGAHAESFRRAGKKITTISLSPPADLVIDYNRKEFTHKFDCVWASHVLEHQPNPHDFLRKCFYDTKDGGWFAVTVPPWKPRIVGGHLNFYNAGLLLYHLIIAGFDCSQAKVKTYGYNISVIVQKKAADLPRLNMDRGDIEKLARYFPLPVQQGFDGDIAELNWRI